MAAPRPARELIDPRRAVRFPVRCAVEVRHRLSRWRAETEDLGPDGLQLVAPRPLPPGRKVRLSLELPRQAGRIEGRATVIWAREAAPTRLGIRFAADRRHAGWWERLRALDPALERTAARPARLPAEARVYLGAAPRTVIDFTRDELAVLRRVRHGTSVGDLAAWFGAAPERLTGALFALLARGSLVLSAARSSGLGAWLETFRRAHAQEVADGNPPSRQPRSTAAQRLLEEGRVHLAAGRVALAAARFREVLLLDPEDAEAREELRAIARFA
jgi:hypothetical protein